MLRRVGVPLHDGSLTRNGEDPSPKHGMLMSQLRNIASTIGSVLTKGAPYCMNDKARVTRIYFTSSGYYTEGTPL